MAVYKCEWFEIDEDLHRKFCRLFPNVDCAREYEAAEVWLICNPHKRYKYYLRFVRSWLVREQGKHDAFHETKEILVAGAQSKAIPDKAAVRHAVRDVVAERLRPKLVNEEMLKKAGMTENGRKL